MLLPKSYANHYISISMILSLTLQGLFEDFFPVIQFFRDHVICTGYFTQNNAMMGVFVGIIKIGDNGKP
jgi:hypothetical protein